MTTTNKVFKDCIVCGETFEDKTRPKNKKTCNRKCADEARKARQREEYRKENPPKPNQRQLYYYDHHEYAFWNTDDKTVRNQFWKGDVPYSTDKIEQISAAKQLYEYHGGRKRRHETIDYDGDEKSSHGVRVRFAEQKEAQKPGEVISYTLSPEELKEYQESRKK